MAKSFEVSVPVPTVQNVEDILTNLGGFGRFQFLILVLILCLEIPTAFVVFSPVFTGKVTGGSALCSHTDNYY
jgi:hypothetical protein